MLTYFGTNSITTINHLGNKRSLSENPDGRRDTKTQILMEMIHSTARKGLIGSNVITMILLKTR